MKKAPVGVSWGTTNTPKEKWIDAKKSYQTKSGKKILGLTIQMTNSLDNEVTFPVKGSIDMGKGKQNRYMIWTLDGLAGLEDKSVDLVEIKA
jgi:hypothetical protein